jgi:hypothetical protein
MGPICCPERSVNDNHSTLRYTPEDRRSQISNCLSLSGEWCWAAGVAEPDGVKQELQYALRAVSNFGKSLLV